MGYKIIRRRGRKFLVVRWFCTDSGFWKEKSLGVTRRRGADTIAEEIIARERLHGLAAPTWDAFRVKFEEERGPRMDSLSQWRTAAKRFEEICNPTTLAAIVPGTFTRFEAGLRARGLREASVRTYMKAIRSALVWAVDLELIDKVPRMKLPKQQRRKIAKGRAITGEEFDRLLAAATRDEATEPERSLAPLLRALWLSGLRLSEALNLWWDREDKIHIDGLDSRRPLLHIPDGALQKNRTETFSPLTPDFVDFLRNLPSRSGPVFTPLSKRGPVRTVDYVGRLISKLGETAKIIVDRDLESDRIKWASAHDLRRSFGDRWSQRVMPAVLKEMMRHRSIETTMTYYVGRSAEQTADVIYAAHPSRDTNGCQSHPVQPSDSSLGSSV